MMAEPRFADDDDLPRTFRRERDARERELREREMPAAIQEDGYGGASGSYGTAAYGYDYTSTGDGSVTVTP